MGRESRAWKDIREAASRSHGSHNQATHKLPSMGPSPISLTQLLGVQVWQQRPTKGRYFPRKGVTASSFIPKPEDHRLVCKGPQGEMRRFKAFGRGREVPGVRVTGGKGRGCFGNGRGRTTSRPLWQLLC